MADNYELLKEAGRLVNCLLGAMSQINEEDNTDSVKAYIAACGWHKKEILRLSELIYKSVNNR